MIISPFIIEVGLDKRFHDYYFIFQIFLVSDFLKNVNHLISQFAYAEFKTNLLLKGNILASIFTILSVLFLFSFEPNNYIYFIPLSIGISYFISIFIQYNKAKAVYKDLNLLELKINERKNCNYRRLRVCRQIFVATQEDNLYSQTLTRM